MSGGEEAAHVHPDLGDDHVGGDAADAGDLTQAVVVVAVISLSLSLVSVEDRPQRPAHHVDVLCQEDLRAAIALPRAPATLLLREAIREPSLVVHLSIVADTCWRHLI
ncbi:hypothetical protein ACIBF6_28785 [Streptosporangium amethystogenes]|uniref:hypothetical protein n=1 Tax=Streptosporangium amethystogenes TaxID=2002 RepID=UPI0037AD6AF2